jgi:myosin heavy subunit
LKAVNVNDVLDVLEKRYLSQQYYTEASNTLIVFNPFCTNTNLYSKKHVHYYDSLCGPNSDTIEDSRPHVYKFAAIVMQNLRNYLAYQRLDHDEFANQTVIVSGESGAGRALNFSF